MNKPILIIGALMVASAGGIGVYLAQRASDPAHQHAPTPHRDAAGTLYYTCAMHPQVHQDTPGQCPICGMKLIEKREATQVDTARPDAASHPAGVSIDPRMVQNLGMRSIIVGSADGAAQAGNTASIEATGSVQIDERRIVAVESRAAGWVEQLAVRAVGDTVTAGQTLAAIYSPDLLAARQELTLAQQTGDAALIDAARTRLRLLGVDAGNGNTTPRIALRSPQAGIVTELLAREGMQISPGMPLLKLADLSRVWIIVDVPESRAAGVVVGATAQARLPGVPDTVFDGQIDYVYPELDAGTRTLRARISLDNVGGRLRPGMYAQVQIGVRHDDRRDDATLRVPAAAVIRTGTRDLVIIDQGQGHYQPTEVQIGAEQHDQIEIRSGLEAGQRIVVSGQFLIDAESNLQGALDRLGTAHAHGDAP